jgi:hypothetical protein
MAVECQLSKEEAGFRNSLIIVRFTKLQNILPLYVKELVEYKVNLQTWGKKKNFLETIGSIFVT